MANTTGTIVTNLGDWIYQSRIQYQAVQKGVALLALPSPTTSQKKTAAMLIQGNQGIQMFTYLVSSGNSTIQSHLLGGTVSAIDDSDIDSAIDTAIATWVAMLDATP